MYVYVCVHIVSSCRSTWSQTMALRFTSVFHAKMRRNLKKIAKLYIRLI